jgi:hypothetical protein
MSGCELIRDPVPVDHSPDCIVIGNDFIRPAANYQAKRSNAAGRHSLLPIRRQCSDPRHFPGR